MIKQSDEKPIPNATRPGQDTFQRLVNIIAQLRGPAGCPWDKQQTPKSMIPYLLEETYEVVEAIE
ncbi:MAG: nucleoside triphosphate hydrolase, partial [Candidatus Marinimicrobia bacterium]|nr:nucleoside triphosphate hydrolase [Candidatus Neomarinimicrobiota bacterium]